MTSYFQLYAQQTEMYAAYTAALVGQTFYVSNDGSYFVDWDAEYAGTRPAVFAQLTAGTTYANAAAFLEALWLVRKIV